MAVRPIDANAMLDELRPVSFEAEHSAVLLSDVSKMMREWVERQPTLTPPNEPLTLEFDVVDTTTGKYPDWERIAREESWAKGLVYCDMDGIAIREDGSLILLDECGNCVSCPPDRFEIRRRPPEGDCEIKAYAETCDDCGFCGNTPTTPPEGEEDT